MTVIALYQLELSINQKCTISANKSLEGDISYAQALNQSKLSMRQLCNFFMIPIFGAVLGQQFFATKIGVLWVRLNIIFQFVFIGTGRFIVIVIILTVFFLNCKTHGVLIVLRLN